MVNVTEANCNTFIFISYLYINLCQMKYLNDRQIIHIYRFYKRNKIICGLAFQIRKVGLL